MSGYIERLATFTVYLLVGIGIMMVVADIANTANEHLGLAGAGFVLVIGGFVLAGGIGTARQVMGEGS